MIITSGTLHMALTVHFHYPRQERKVLSAKEGKVHVISEPTGEVYCTVHPVEVKCEKDPFGECVAEGARQAIATRGKKETQPFTKQIGRWYALNRVLTDMIGVSRPEATDEYRTAWRELLQSYSKQAKVRIPWSPKTSTKK